MNLTENFSRPSRILVLSQCSTNLTIKLSVITHTARSSIFLSHTFILKYVSHLIYSKLKWVHPVVRIHVMSTFWTHCTHQLLIWVSVIELRGYCHLLPKRKSTLFPMLKFLTNNSVIWPCHHTLPVLRGIVSVSLSLYLSLYISISLSLVHNQQL